MWVCRVLRELHPDVSLAATQQHVLSTAAALGPTGNASAAWWRLPGADDPPRAALLVAGAFHLSADPSMAWGCLSHALWHAMATTLPIDSAAAQ